MVLSNTAIFIVQFYNDRYRILCKPQKEFPKLVKTKYHLFCMILIRVIQRLEFLLKPACYNWYQSLVIISLCLVLVYHVTFIKMCNLLKMIEILYFTFRLYISLFHKLEWYLYAHYILREIAVVQQTRARDRTFEGVLDSGCTPVPAGQPRPYLVNLWPNFSKSSRHALECSTCSY